MISNKMNLQTHTPRHTIIKTINVKDKEEILKGERKKQGNIQEVYQ